MSFNPPANSSGSSSVPSMPIGQRWPANPAGQTASGPQREQFSAWAPQFQQMLGGQIPPQFQQLIQQLMGNRQ